MGKGSRLLDVREREESMEGIYGKVCDRRENGRDIMDIDHLVFN